MEKLPLFMPTFQANLCADAEGLVFTVERLIESDGLSLQTLHLRQPATLTLNCVELSPRYTGETLTLRPGDHLAARYL